MPAAVPVPRSTTPWRAYETRSASFWSSARFPFVLALNSTCPEASLTEEITVGLWWIPRAASVA